MLCSELRNILSKERREKSKDKKISKELYAKLFWRKVRKVTLIASMWNKSKIKKQLKVVKPLFTNTFISNGKIALVNDDKVLKKR